MSREYEIGPGGPKWPNVTFSSALISTIQFYYKLGRNYSKVGMGNTKLFKGYPSPIFGGAGGQEKIMNIFKSRRISQ